MGIQDTAKHVVRIVLIALEKILFALPAKTAHTFYLEPVTLNALKVIGVAILIRSASPAILNVSHAQVGHLKIVKPVNLIDF